MGAVEAEPTAACQAGPAAPDRLGEDADGGALLAQELLVEEISIDGMCGVY